MVLKTNHLRARIGIEDLKDLLIKDEKHKSILNTTHNIWLCVEYSATELAHSKGESDIPEDSESDSQKLANTIFILQAAIVVKLVGGSTNNKNFKNVTIEYYHYKKRRTKAEAEEIYGTEFITMVEKFKATYETYFKRIKKEEYAKKHAKLAEVLGEERTKYLLSTDYDPYSKLLQLIKKDNFFTNEYVDLSNTTTPDERAQLLKLGIDVQI